MYGLQFKMIENSGLVIAEIELTNRCNLNCKHCYNDKSRIYDLKETEVYGLIDEFAELNVYRLVFTGGEPLLDKNLFKYAKYSKDKGIKEIALLTNGILLKKFNIDKLQLFDVIQLSIDTPPSQETTLRENYSSLLIEHILFLQKNNIKVNLQATLHKSLVPHLKELSDFSEKMGIQIGINNLIPLGNAKDIQKEILSPFELKKALKKISDLKNINCLIKCSIPLFFLEDEERKGYYENKLNENRIIGGCSAGISSLYVNSKGDVYPCPFLQVPIASIKEKKISDIWQNNSILNKLRARNFSGKCGSCKYNLCCGGCRSFAYYIGGDMFGSDEKCWYNPKNSNT